MKTVIAWMLLNSAGNYTQLVGYSPMVKTYQECNTMYHQVIARNPGKPFPNPVCVKVNMVVLEQVPLGGVQK